ncbi:FAD:protein FMN transferase [Meridianimarinicoccus sp. MJW13]|uniref:FAD:protein FMN transferase n=1 Tax=Meridianimarinicoccus sp. MJW13 TaxID=2720031 RepID=UPI001868E18E|nr:FAD:protein FMN transferase [Fluviibacterium sp. MJW13]
MRPALLLAVATLPLAGCLFDDTPETLKISGKTMGTTYNITVVDAPDGTTKDDLVDRVETVLADVNGKMSNWDPNSEVSLFNAALSTEAVTVSAPFAQVLSAANDIHQLSGGKFDVTLAPLIDLWGFGAKKPGDPIPSDAEIAQALQSVGQSTLLELDGTTLRKLQPEVSVNLSAIAKGYGVDQIAAALRAEGIDRYLVEIGGDLATGGLNAEDSPWSIGIERPDTASRTVEEIVLISDKGLATSGDYRNYFEQDGVRYSHIIDPTTGKPVIHQTASITVIADTAMMADAWATALLVVGSETAFDIAEQAGVAVLAIDRNNDQFVTRTSPAFDALVGTKD